jgi:Thiamine pyrophosphate enzyme, C-terminal TPP binding domain
MKIAKTAWRYGAELPGGKLACGPVTLSEFPENSMKAFGGKGFYVEEPRDLKGALEEAMNFKGPALVNCLLSQGSAGKPQQFRWHS